MNWDDIWGKAKEGIGNAWEQAQTVGIPVIKAAAENEAIKLLNKQHEQTTQELNAAVASAANQPASPIGQAISDVLKPAFFETYKTQILVGGAAAIIGVAFIARSWK